MIISQSINYGYKSIYDNKKAVTMDGPASVLVAITRLESALRCPGVPRLESVLVR